VADRDGGRLPGALGTTYPANLRLVVAGMSEAQWIKHARQERLPPMPWFNLRVMDGRGPGGRLRLRPQPRCVGVAAPAYVAPGGKVSTPYLVFVPQTDQKSRRMRPGDEIMPAQAPLGGAGVRCACPGCH